METILIVAIAFIIAGSRIAYDVVRRNDLKNGIVIDSSEYSLFGTFKDLFRTKKGREMAERGITFQNHVRKATKLYYIISGGYIATAILSAVLLFKPENPIFIFEAAAVLMMIIHMISKSTLNYVLAFTMSVLGMIYGFMSGSVWGLFSVLGGIPLGVYLIREYAKYRKTINKAL